MTGICTNCGLAYAPDSRVCAQCGQELGEDRPGFLARLFGRDREQPDPPPPATPETVWDLAEGMLERLDGASDDAVTYRTVTSSTSSSISVSVDGETHTYESFDDLPPDIRARIQQAFDQVEQLGIDMPDLDD